METFQFENHKRNFKFLNNSDSIQLGNGYEFVSKPRSPVLKEFTLTFSGFRYYFDSEGNVDHEANKYWDNAAALCDFFAGYGDQEGVGTYQTFIYPDEQFGNVQVRFADPLEIPQTDGRRAVVKEFSIRLKEVSE